MTQDLSHLHAIEDRLFSERARLRAATKPSEIEWRTMNVAGIERELQQERKFLGLPPQQTIDEILAEMSDDDLLAELMA